MTDQAPILVPASRRRLLAQTGAALLAATVFAVLVVLPAEFAIDPTGFGRAAGLTRLAAPQAARPAAAVIAQAAAIHHPSKTPFRSDVIEITLAPGGGEGADTERKVWMEPGQTLVSAWTADGEVYSDFHGETLQQPKVEVMGYQTTDPLQGDDPKAASGGFTAPMAGFHGWYFKNLEVRPVTIRVRISGFYEPRPYPPAG